jgi:P4 family phage/plasmid primase-like protien
MDSVLDILENTKVFSEYFTHVSMIEPMGKYNISRDNMDLFWDKYCTEIYENGDSAMVGIAEQMQTYLPVLVDIDIKLPFSEDKDVSKLYTDHQIDSVVRDYQETLRKIVNDITPQHLICFVFEKPAYKCKSGSNEYIKNGFHLHFPYTFLSKNDHEAHLIPRVKMFIEKSGVFKPLGFEKSSDLVDTGYTRAPWLLYGSRKHEEMDPYVLTRVLDQDREQLTIEQALADYKIYDSDENEIALKDRCQYFLPRVLSVIPWCRPVCEIKPNLPSMLKLSVGREKVKRDYNTKILSETLERVKKYVAILSDRRAETYSDWMQVGWTLYNITNGTEDGMMIWLDFSSRCPEKFDEQYCIATWEKMETRNMSIGTLKHFAKEDNPIEYEKLVRSQSDEYIKQSLSGSHYDLAKACFEMYGHEFVCASVASNTWYQYKNHRWVPIEEGTFLRQKLSEDFVKTFSDKGKEIFDKMTKCSDDDKDMYAAQQKQIQKMVNNLKTSSFKCCVMKECKDVFYNENFFKNLNKNAWLIGFRNGVYDLKANIFRPGIPEDYISSQMAIEYSEYKESDRIVQEVHQFFEKIFPDRDVRDYFIDMAADVFVGGNPKKHVYFWSGEGNNGKSITELFFSKMFGEYAIKLPTSLIVGKRGQSSAASPELVRAGNGVRWTILQEPDKRDVINIGLLKELSGNDSFFARGLFAAGGEIDPLFKITVICNDPPSVPYSDNASWNRIRVIPFESTFTDNAPEDPDQQLLTKTFPKDKYFQEKVPSMLKPFAWILLNHRKKGLARKEDPIKVTLATAGYQKMNDTFRQFVDERIIETPSGRINLAELYTSFKEWFKENVPGQTMPIKSEVRSMYTKMWGEPEKGGVWKGRRSKTFEDELESGEVMVIETQE